jgi:hypothetical protein
VLVLRRGCPHDEIPRPAPLPQYYNGGSKSGGVGIEDPGSIRVPLPNPRWERRLLRFLELSGMERTVEGGPDEEEAHAARIDGWIVWEAEEEGARRDG